VDRLSGPERITPAVPARIVERVRVVSVGGAIALIVILLIFPVIVGMSGAIGAALLGGLVKNRVDDKFEGSELLDANK
jgi:hypothetical protein